VVRRQPDGEYRACTTRYEERFSQLASDHADRNLQPADYRIFGEVLVESLRYFEGPRWTKEKQAAWESAIERAATLISTAESDGATA
jgi:hemoglobin-like flavoprotein